MNNDIAPQVGAEKRSKGLRKLGVTEEDVHVAAKLLEESDRLRDKALKLLGTTEKEIEVENAKNLGSLGIEGRRRSYTIIAHDSEIAFITKSKALPLARGSIFSKLRNYGERHTVSRRHTVAVIKRRKSSIDKSKTMRRRSSDSEVSIAVIRGRRTFA